MQQPKQLTIPSLEYVKTGCCVTIQVGWGLTALSAQIGYNYRAIKKIKVC